MTEKTEESNNVVRKHLFYALLGFVVGVPVGMMLDPSCGPSMDTSETQPLGKPAPEDGSG